jgi:hypothetical protein
VYNESSGRRAILKLLIKSPPAAAAQRIKTSEREREMYGLMEKYIIHTPPESRAYQYLKR